MVRLSGFAAVLLGVFMALQAVPVAAQSRGDSLSAFRSEAELRRFLKSTRPDLGRGGPPPAPPPPVPAPVPLAPTPSPNVSLPAPLGATNEIVVTASRSEGLIADVSSPISVVTAESITNTQEANVDEGGIVKNRGELLVILRRGRLFTVSTTGGRLTPVDSIDAFPPGVDPVDDWYDEMLLVGDQVIVIGYSYERGGTEVNRFRLDPAGRLRFVDAYHLRGADYYSEGNYASRLIGSKLVLYSGREISWGQDPLEVLPAMRRWKGQEDPNLGFRRIVTATQVFIPPLLRRVPEDIDTVHSVITCDLAATVLDCDAVAVLGPDARVFYVSAGAVYLWIADYDFEADGRMPPAMIYRLPLDGRRPQAVGARGAPVDQFSFREDAGDRTLNVVVRAEGGGDGMWRKGLSGGAVALVRIPLGDFGNGSRELPFGRYRDLPEPEPGQFTNRFVGDYLLYGSGSGWSEREGNGGQIHVAAVAGGEASRFDLTHPIDRIEVMGPDAVVVGSTDKAMVFSTVELPAAGPKLGDRYVLPDAAEAETRSHAFFYRPDPPDGVDGVLGLPVSRAGNPAYNQLFQNAASMFFLRRQARKFDPLGELKSASEGFADDGCRASCVDWYGNARPIFLRGRVYALLGYELVEGRIEGGRIREVGRVSFAPKARR